MKKKLFSKPLWISLTSVFAVIMAALIAGSCIAFQYTEAINSYFDVDTDKFVDKETSGEDTEYIKSEYEDDEELWYSTEEYCQQAVAKGSVLLWNNGDTLPLARNSRVSLFSHSSVDILYSGTGSAAFSWDGAPTLRDALEDSRLSVNETLWDFYLKQERRTQLPSLWGGSNANLQLNETPWSSVMSGCASSFADYGDAAIVVIARSGGEDGDLAFGPNGYADTIDNNYLNLTQEEVDMLDYLTGTSSGFEKVIVIINSANALQFSELSKYRNKIGACLWIGTPGYSGIYAVGELLTGAATPSGRLPDTYCYNNTTAPSLINFSMRRTWDISAYSSLFSGKLSNVDHYTVYQEGIYVGYRYYETRYEDVVLGQGNAGNYDYASTVIFPFGYGKSYTQFAYDGFSVTEKNGDYEVSVTVHNDGDYKGADTVQIFLQKPYTSYDRQHGLEKASVELVGFAKTNVLRPGKSQTITITVPAERLRTFDDDNQQTYILEEGDYYLAFGTDAHDALNNILKKKSDGGVSVDVSKMTAAGDAGFVKKLSLGENDTVFSENGKVTSCLSLADINKYEGTKDQHIVYLTRNNWEGTFPKQAVTLTVTEKMAQDLTWNKAVTADPDAVMPTLGAERAVKLIDLREVDFDSSLWDTLLNQLTFEEMCDLVSNGYCATKAVESIGKPATKESDGALGIGSTYARPSAYRAMGWPCEPIIAATRNTELVEEIGQLYGEDMLHSDVSGIYSPGMNIHRNAYGGRNFEYYSEDPYLAGAMASAQVRGVQSVGCYVFMKHFVINETEIGRHGLATFADEQTIRELYLYPFEIGVKEGGALGLMSSYNRIGCIWTGGCKELCTDILRGEWGFEGMVITDYGATANDIFSYIDGLMSGVDKYFNSGETFDYTVYRNNPTVVNALRQASHRILYVVSKTHAMNGLTSTTEVVKVTPWWQSAIIAVDVIVGVLLLVSVGMLTASFFVKKEKDAE